MKHNFDSLNALRKSNRPEFITILFKEHSVREFLTGEIALTSTVKKKDMSEITVDKFIILTDEEKKILLDLCLKENDKAVQKIIIEGDARYEKAVKRVKLLPFYSDNEIAIVVTMAIQDSEISDEDFIDYCKTMSYQKEIRGKLWCSYLFQGFITLEKLIAKQNEYSILKPQLVK
jgi:hypothetical protein